MIMSNNLSNKKLGIIFGVLALLVIIYYFGDMGQNERTFREELVEIDTSSVTEILIYPKSQNLEEVKIFKDSEGWRVNLPSGNTAAVQKSKIENIYSQLLSIKPKRLAARGSSKWTEFEVDSSATRVKVIEDGTETLDILFGRFSFQQPRSMSTYVRLHNDTDVYEVDGFLSATFNQGANSFRDNTIIQDNYEDWQNLTFNYPADSSYQLSRMNDKWFANDDMTDSAETAKNLRQLQRQTSTSFLDEVEESDLSSPDFKLTVTKKDSSTFEISGYQIDSLFVISSSLNPDTYFDGTKNDLKNKVFPGRGKFFK